MYLETSGLAIGSSARLLTPELTEGGPYCLTFYYHLYGIHVGELQVEELVGSLNDTLLLTKELESYDLTSTNGG